MLTFVGPSVAWRGRSRVPCRNSKSIASLLLPPFWPALLTRHHQAEAAVEAEHRMAAAARLIPWAGERRMRWAAACRMPWVAGCRVRWAAECILAVRLTSAARRISAAPESAAGLRHHTLRRDRVSTVNVRLPLMPVRTGTPAAQRHLAQIEMLPLAETPISAETPRPISAETPTLAQAPFPISAKIGARPHDRTRCGTH